jgi:uncharacterized membrane protein YfcA
MAGLLTGLSVTLFGSSGMLLAFPAFHYLAGLGMKPAVAASVVAIGITSLVAALIAVKDRVGDDVPGEGIDVLAGGLTTIGGLIGCYAGARLSVYVPDFVQALVFGAVMIALASGMLRRLKRKSSARTDGVDKARKLPTMGFMAFVGLVVGLLTGILGMACGFLLVPALHYLGGVPFKRAAPTSLWVMAAYCTSGVAGYADHLAIPMGPAMLFAGLAIVGLVVARPLAGKPNPRLQAVFAALVLAVGGLVVAQSGSAGSQPPSHHVVAHASR